MTPPVASLPEGLVQIDLTPKKPAPKPVWLKAKAPMGETFHNLKKMARELNLHTVCESAQCPNIGECWNQKSATFMMLGNLCTRRCGFCAVPKGKPEPIDFDEPRRVAYAVAQLGLAHAVHERWPPIKIILVSGQLKPANTEIPANSRFFGKPLEAKVMIALMQCMIGRA